MDLPIFKFNLKKQTEIDLAVERAVVGEQLKANKRFDKI